MNEATPDDEIARTLTFEDGRHAVIVLAEADPDLLRLLGELGLQPGRPVIVVAGGAETLSGDAYALAVRVAGPAVVRAATLTGAAVVDRGTATGIMGITGRAMREHGEDDAVLLGVAPAGRVTFPGGAPGGAGDAVELEPNHSHFVLADSDEWGGETTLLLELSVALAGGSPVVMLLAGGGKGAQEEALQAARRGWPLFVLVGTGGKADAVAGAWRSTHEQRPTRVAAALPRARRVRASRAVAVAAAVG
jgi:hypothetical protein